jgi:hypothetical protein
VGAEEKALGSGGLACGVHFAGDQHSAAVCATAGAVANFACANLKLVFDDFDTVQAIKTTLQIAGWLFVLFVHPDTSPVTMRRGQTMTVSLL